MRELRNEDFYLISEIADLMDFELPSPTKEEKGKKVSKTQEEYGKELLTLLLKKAYKAKEPINQLISNLTGKPIEEIQSMPFKETGKALTELFTKQGFMDFFK